MTGNRHPFGILGTDQPVSSAMFPTDRTSSSRSARAAAPFPERRPGEREELAAELGLLLA